MGSTQTKHNYILPGIFYVKPNVIDISKVEKIELDLYDNDKIIHAASDKHCKYLFYVLYHKTFIACNPKKMRDIYFIDDNFSASLHIHIPKNKIRDEVLVINIDEIDRFIF